MKWVPFHWDNDAQKFFDALKDVLVWEYPLYPPNCQCNYFMYLVVVISTISMVLIQEYNVGIEHPTYYLSQNLNDTEIRYTHVEKLSLVVVQAIQRFHHYILLLKTTVVSYCNPMTYILSFKFLGGKYSKWIIILQEFDLEHIKSKSKKSLVLANIMCNLPSPNFESTSDDYIPDELLFLISSSEPWYGDILIYLETHAF